MTKEGGQMPPLRQHCNVKDCPNEWDQLCRICGLPTCMGHITLVKNGGIPGGHLRCPTCTKLSLGEALTVWQSPEAEHRRQVFAGRILLLLQERISSEEWHWMMEEVKSLGGDTERLREAIRATIKDMGQYASRHDEET